MPSTPKYTPRREKRTLPACTESSKKRKLNKKMETVQVFCRMKPLDLGEYNCLKITSSTSFTLQTPPGTKLMPKDKDVNYVFKQVFTPYAGQERVFEQVALPLVEDLLKGKNGLLFAYGVSGSGKTYTLQGNYRNPGLIPNCIHTLFNTIETLQTPKFVVKPDKMNGFEVQTIHQANADREMEFKALKKTPSRTKGFPYPEGCSQYYINHSTEVANVNENHFYCVFISYVEIYNNIVFDLLETGKILQGKILREDAQKNMYVHGVVEIEVKSAQEAFKVLNAAQKRKHIGHTLLNSDSSRSHCIFTMRVVQLQKLTNDTEGIKNVSYSTDILHVGQLNLVDLAGSERTNRAQNTGVRLREASKINNSLMSLRTCMEILRNNQITGNNKLVPYRESRLTLLFKSYFEGEFRVEMIVCLNPSAENYDENLHVMNFAEMTQEVKVAEPVAVITPYRKVQSTPLTQKAQSTRIQGTPSAANFSRNILSENERESLFITLDDDGDSGPAISRLIGVLRQRKEKSLANKTMIEQRIAKFRQYL